MTTEHRPETKTPQPAKTIKPLKNKSEVARILNQIREEYDAALNALSGSSQGSSRHSFITTKMENMGKLQTTLNELVGDNAIALVVQALENVDQPMQQQSQA